MILGTVQSNLTQQKVHIIHFIINSMFYLIDFFFVNLVPILALIEVFYLLSYKIYKMALMFYVMSNI